MTTELLLGIDSGQTVCKAALFDLSGREVAVTQLPNAVASPRPRWLERDPDEVWRQVGAAVRTALQRAEAATDGPVRVLAVSVCGHGDGTYLVDGDGRPTRPAILATDSRAAGEAAELRTGAVAERALAVTGQVPFAGSPAAVLTWLKRHEPETLARSRWALFCKDFLRLRLTGEVATDPTEACASFTDLAARHWSPAALDLYDLGDLAHLMPPVLDSAALAGTVTPAAAETTGLPVGTPVITGAHDVDAAAIGIGAHRDGDYSVVLGTFSINQVVAPAAVAGSAWQARLFAWPGHWLHMSTSPAGAANLDWVIRRFGPWTPGGDPDPAAAVAEAAPVLTDLQRAATAPLFLPFLFGAPGGDGPGAGWVGGRGWHQRADLLYAVLEGIVLNHRTHLDILRTTFPMARPIRVCGGGARSPEWTQLLADAVGAPVEVTDSDEAGGRGAAILAGIGAGCFTDLDDAVARTVRVVRRHDPDPDRTAVLDERYQRYRTVVTALS